MRSGSRAIRRFLNNTADILGEDPKRDASGKPTNPWWHHSDAETVKRLFEEKGWNWNDYFVFTNVRNPWDRVSTLFYHGYNKLHKGWAPWLDAAERSGNNLTLFLQQPEMAEAKPLDKFIQSNDGKVLVNKVIRIEDGLEALMEITKLLNIPEAELDISPVIKKVGLTKDKPHYSRFFDDNSKAIVANMYSYDIEVAGYKFEKLQ